MQVQFLYTYCADALFKFIVWVRFFFFYCCGAGAGAGAVFLDFYGAGAVFLNIIDWGCETAPALRSLVTPRLVISVKSGDTNNQNEVSPKIKPISEPNWV